MSAPKIPSLFLQIVAVSSLAILLTYAYSIYNLGPKWSTISFLVGVALVMVGLGYVVLKIRNGQEADKKYYGGQGGIFMLLLLAFWGCSMLEIRQQGVVETAVVAKNRQFHYLHRQKTAPM
ncbi:MAG: hypothetical protein IPL65_21135 [Lewinellaceae bacterium]|nr:hypothetical protein [Lewinellaceae bacterium]